MDPQATPGKGSPPTGGLPFYRLRLFVAGNEPNSATAKAVLARICDKYLGNRCEVRIVDVFEDFQAAIDHQITAVPALIVETPPPPKIIVGSLSDENKVLAALGVFPKGGGV